MDSLTESVHPSVSELRTFGLGQMDAAEAAVIEEHVSHCDACCRTLADVRSDTFIDILKSSSQSAPAVQATEAVTLAPGGPAPSAAGDRTSADSDPIDAPAELLRHPRYRVLGLLGSGGMGAVYKAEHRLMERVVALKVMTRALVGSAATVERFRREFKASARLSHPNIVAAYDAEQAGDLPFLVMEYVEGTDLARWVAERGPLPAEEACEYVRQAALGLQHAHEHGMIHRDIKPHNLMRTPDGTVKILDFGLARLVAEAGSGQGGVTGQGILLGTVDYLAPEQADDARQADIRSDIYSLGCTLYHLLSGRPPFPQGTVVQKIMAHTQRDPLPLDELRPDLPPGLARVVSRLMAKSPDDRYQTPAEVCEALAPFAGQTVVLDPAPAAAGRTKDKGQRTKRTKRFASRPLVLCTLALALAALAAAAVYRVQTDNGELVITTDNPDVEVVIKQNGKLVRIVDTKTNKEVKLESGLYDLELKGQPDDLKLSLDKVTIRRGETVVATVERRPKEVAEKAGEVRRFEGHRGGIIGVSYAPDGRHVLSTSYDQTVRLWDVSTGKEVRRFEGHTAWPYAAVLSPDGRHVLSGGDDLVLRIWDAQTGKELRPGEGHTRGITWIAVSPDSRRALTGSWDGTVRLWKVESGEQLRVLEGHTDVVQSVAFSPDGKRALSAGNDKMVRLWDLETGKELRSLEGHAGPVMSAAFSPDGRRALSGSMDKTVRLWDVDTGKQLRCLEGHTSPVTQVAFTPDGRHALSAASPEGDEEGERCVRVWDLGTGKDLHRVETGVANRMAVSPDGRYAVMSSPGHPDPRLWRLPDLTPEKVGEVRRFEGHDGTVRAVAYSADGRYVLSGSGWPAGDKTARLWDAATGKEVRRFEGHTENVSSVALSADGRHVLTGSDDRTVRVWDASTGKEIRSLKGHDLAVFAVAFSPDGRRALSGSMDETARLWDVETGQEVRKFQGHGGWVTGVAFSPDGRRAATSSNDKTVRLWDVETGKELRKFEGHTDSVHAVAYSPDGKWLLSAGSDKTARLWDVETGKEVRVFRGHRAGLTSVAFSPDSRRALSGGIDQTVRLWDVGTGKELHCFDGHRGGVWGVVFSPDGGYALSGSGGSFRDGEWDPGRDWTLRLWRLPDLPAK
jgi:WD40 repeat protein